MCQSQEILMLGRPVLAIPGIPSLEMSGPSGRMSEDTHHHPTPTIPRGTRPVLPLTITTRVPTTAGRQERLAAIPLTAVPMTGLLHTNQTGWSTKGPQGGAVIIDTKNMTSMVATRAAARVMARNGGVNLAGTLGAVIVVQRTNPGGTKTPRTKTQTIVPGNLHPTGSPRIGEIHKVSAIKMASAIITGPPRVPSEAKIITIQEIITGIITGAIGAMTMQR